MDALAPDRALDWAVAERPMPGEVESGDGYLVAPFPDGVLIAVIDGLGHGEEAALAARIAVLTLETHADLPVASLFALCHERLHGTRGAVMTIASIRPSDSTMTWAAVGNVEAILLRPSAGLRGTRDSLLLRGGVVGYQIPPIRVVTLPVRPEDVLILATDGLVSAFSDDLDVMKSAAGIANDLLTRFARPADDALVFVARLLGGSE